MLIPRRRVRYTNIHQLNYIECYLNHGIQNKWQLILHFYSPRASEILHSLAISYPRWDWMLWQRSQLLGNRPLDSLTACKRWSHCSRSPWNQNKSVLNKTSYSHDSSQTRPIISLLFRFLKFFKLDNCNPCHKQNLQFLPHTCKYQNDFIF